MRKPGRRYTYTVVIIVMVMLLANLSMLPKANAGDTESKEAIQLNVNTSIPDNLAALKGKMVAVTLSSGQTFTGIVGEVNGNLLHLVKLSQKDFYDALVVVDRISAIEARVR